MHRFTNKVTLLFLMNNLPPVTKNLLIINVLLFAATYVAKLYGTDLEDLLGLHFALASRFHFYQIFTYMFMHHGLTHIFFNMFAVWMFGRIMESTMGSRRFLFYYLTCGLGAGLTQELVQYISYMSQGLAEYEHLNTGISVMAMSEYLNRWTTVGASGCVYGVLLSFGMTYPNERLFIIPFPFPIKAKYFVTGYALIELLYAVNGSSDGVAHFAHLGGMVIGFVLLMMWRNGGASYGRKGLWDSLRDWADEMGRRLRRWRHGRRSHLTAARGGKFNDEMDYNMRKKERDAEIDRILDKVKKHGYGCLTEEEKRRIFRG